MTEQRRSLTDSLKATPPVSPEVAHEFIHAGTIKSFQANTPSATRPASAVQPRTNYSTPPSDGFCSLAKTCLAGAAVERYRTAHYGRDPGTSP